ncbi:unnamed protein product [Paramecium pentaurelia]|uniref:RING-type domain-containing protein n=1 Tax=Paramecium pentaurelia TaxID=43138 RepID=A0A8S1V103_9CILI|nr:unnamed protein product [Paramecium pentaurelia]
MKSENQDYVRCKYCKKRIHQCQMYAHKLECNQSNHPNYQSEIQSRINENQSQFQSQNNHQQQSRLQQSSSRQPVQFVESHIYSSQKDNNSNLNKIINNPRRSDNPEYKNTSQVQRIQQQNINQYNESLLKRTQKKCEYCDQEYPIEILEEHYPLCDTKKLIEQLSIEEYQDENIHEQQNTHHNPYENNDDYIQQQINNQNHIHYNQPQHRNHNQVTRTKVEVLPDGTIRKTIITTNLNTGQVQSQRIITQASQQQQQQQQQHNLFPIFNMGRNQIQRNSLQALMDQILSNPFFSNQTRRGFFFIPMMNHLHQAPQELENLAIIKFVPYDGLSQEYKQCSICINNYEDGEELILLPCIHRFHKKCISEWFKEQSTCPICKTDVTQQEMGFEEDDQE